MLPGPAAGGVSLASAEHIRQSQGMMNILRIVLSQQTANNIQKKEVLILNQKFSVSW